MPTVAYMNPLGRTLSHFERETVETLSRIGAEPVSLDSRDVEGQTGPVGKARMLRDALRNARTVRRSPADLTLSLWPSTGMYDFLLQASSTSRTFVILHDPKPIRRQIGFGRTALLLANTRRGRMAGVVVHSQEALAEARQLLPRHEIRLLPHPVLTLSESAQESRSKVVLVAGQFKPTRNVELMNALARPLREAGFVPRVVGRGWSGVVSSDWEVNDGFLSEQELDREIGLAHTVLIPYSRYYQSGIAVRAVELGTPVVGETNSFLAELTGDGCSVRVGAEVSEYLRAIESSQQVSSGSHSVYRRRVDEAWATFVSDGVKVGSGR